jgi:hypothetical protein
MEKSIVRQEEFGKDLGLIHEVVVTGRKAGATKKFWAKLAHNEHLFRLVVEQVLIEEGWLKDILASERQCHLDFFGQEFDLSEFEETLQRHGEEKIKNWQWLYFEPHFLPDVIMAQSVEFHGWKVKPENLYYEKIAKGKILRDINGKLAVDKDPFKLEGITVLIDTRLKPAYDNGKQMYSDDNLLGPILKQLREEGKIAKYEYGSQFSRFGVSADEWENQIKPVLAEKLGLNLNQLRLERAIEANIIPQLYSHMPRRSDGYTNTWVWYEEYFGGRRNRLSGGDSNFGGLAFVSYYFSVSRDGSFRPLAVL